MDELEALLKRRSKGQLVALLLDIFAMYPHLIDDLAVETGPPPFDPVASVARLFERITPPGHLHADQGAVLLRKLAGQADKLARRGQRRVARQIYYELARHCVDRCASFGRDYFSDNIVYEFVEAYNELALPQVKRERAQIEAEVEVLLADPYLNLDLELESALLDVAVALGWWEEVT